MDEIVFALVTASVSLLAGAGTRELLNRIAPRVFRRLISSSDKEQSYSARLQSLSATLTKSSREVDSVIQDLQEVAADRASAVKKLEEDLQALSDRESKLRTKIEHLEKVPLPVAEYFAELSSPGERKSARRDYILFGAGIVFSVVTAIVLKQLGVA